MRPSSTAGDDAEDRAPRAGRDSHGDPRTIRAARARPMSERLELALSWNAVAAELRAGLAGVRTPPSDRR